MSTAPSRKNRHLTKKRSKESLTFIIILDIIFSLAVTVPFQERNNADKTYAQRRDVGLG